ncbi:MAG: UDP-N-acetylmuramoyl-L-alanine--D-glutamate ligase [Patescibacteria group bacterium]
MKIALAGFGQEGRISYDYWNRDGNQLTIVDERDAVEGLPEGTLTILGAGAFAKLSEFDLVIRSPGINPKRLPYEDKVWSATNEFFEKCPAPIIGVTGTKGKGTTSSLIASILRAAGKTVHLVGNIGVPALGELASIGADDIVVYELSSFQLWDVKKSPHVAVMLMIEPDHLDIHDDMNDYLNAKLNIVRHQTENDVSIVHRSLSDVITLPPNRTSYMKYPDEDTVYAKDGWFYVKHQKFIQTSVLQIPGLHNIENACAAIAAAGSILSSAYDSELEAIFKEGLSSFAGLPHRLKFVAEKNGVEYYDDSIATTPGSAIAAIRSFERPKVLLLGGHDKGAGYDELMSVCREADAKIIAIGANGDNLVELAAQHGVTCVRETGDMPAIVARADEIAQPGDVVILSPAAASFDMFKSYADRGDQFIAAVRSLQS